jgi:hypothetical protein
MAVAGEPRNRDLAFATLLRFAQWFNPRFEAATTPQVLVANAATVKALGSLGRRLAYLPTDGPHPAPADLVRLGRHLRFLWDHAGVPGQQLMVSLTDLLNAHWVTPQSPLERESLAALDAFIDPPPGMHGFNAALEAELRPVGPIPDAESDHALLPLLEHFNKIRGKSTAPAVVRPLLHPIEAHYRPLVEQTWELLWRCRNREESLPEAKSVGRRWNDDVAAHRWHLDWLAKVGLRRTRQSPRQAAMTLRRLEDATRQLEAEEACDDPVRMIGYIVQNKAVRGKVVRTDCEHKERLKRLVRRPLVILHSPDPCLMPVGKELYWEDWPNGRVFVVQSVEAAPSGGSFVTLKLMTGDKDARMPLLGAETSFSVLEASSGWFVPMPETDPWTHRASGTADALGPIEEEKQIG